MTLGGWRWDLTIKIHCLIFLGNLRLEVDFILSWTPGLTGILFVSERSRRRGI